MNNLIEQLQKAPLAQKLGGVALLIMLMSVGNYFGLISPLEDQINALKQTQSQLDSEYAQKKTIANNLNSYKQRLEKLEQELALALTKLPQSPEIDELLRQLNDVGKKAGLAITGVTPGAEGAGEKDFIAKIPIAMSVSGSYEEIAVFFESVSKLRRIVNISDIELTTPAKRNEKVVLAAKFSATTFRFKQAAAKAAAKPAAGAK